jgi:hypothetical protein
MRRRKMLASPHLQQERWLDLGGLPAHQQQEADEHWQQRKKQTGPAWRKIQHQNPQGKGPSSSPVAKIE